MTASSAPNACTSFNLEYTLKQTIVTINVVRLTHTFGDISLDVLTSHKGETIAYPDDGGILGLGLHLWRSIQHPS